MNLVFDPIHQLDTSPYIQAFDRPLFVALNRSDGRFRKRPVVVDRG